MNARVINNAIFSDEDNQAGIKETGFSNCEYSKDIFFELKNGKSTLGAKQYGEWFFRSGSWENSGIGWETLTSTRHSARKEIHAQASFSFLPDAEGGAGIQLGRLDRTENRGWIILYCPKEKAVKICDASYDDGKLSMPVLKKAGNVESESENRMEIIPAKETWCIMFNGKHLLDYPFLLPVFEHSGITAVNMKAKFSCFRIEGKVVHHRIAAFGDSITHHCRWQDAVAKKLGIKIGNAGLACEDSKNALKRFETDVCGASPEKTIIFIGTNNEKPISAIDDIAMMVKIARKHKIIPAVAELLPRPDDKDVRSFNVEIRKFAEREKLPLFDWFHVLADQSGRMPSAYGDVHPNEEGISALAEYICSKPELVTFLKD